MLDQMLQKKGQEVDRVLDFQVPDSLLVSQAEGLHMLACLALSGLWCSACLQGNLSSGAVSVCMLRWALTEGQAALIGCCSRKALVIRAPAAHCAVPSLL